MEKLEERGITLLAVVITVLVLLILLMVVLSQLVENNKIIEKRNQEKKMIEAVNFSYETIMREENKVKILITIEDKENGLKII